MVSMYRTVAALLLFGVSFGYLEAAVVVYLRAIYDPIRQRIHPGRSPQDLFPLISPDQLKAAGPENARRLAIEIGREAAPLLCWPRSVWRPDGISISAWRLLPIAFGLWDISFYAFLRLMIGWPQSLFTWDILFLIPLPWVGPVITPVLVSITLIACGLVSLFHGGLPAKPWQWTAMIAGGVVVILAFVWDFRNTTSGGQPNPFNWPLFLAGEAIALAGFIAAAKNPGFQESRIPRGS